ncbi:DgyrCDS14695 [Dimorphilus gyrociliatus]|uniref:DgyrCDS14695 n=1 Tax=Dimorphilus gyrociliatus TaxID=2664684 RepID=A0A7I8WEV3_9ANNE|nr:DgyrCDS14695 [Dimorphilus gyrociliatus]
MEYFPTVEEQDSGSSQVRNISNPIQEVESSSKQLDPRIKNLRMIAKCTNSPNQLETTIQGTNMVNLAMFEEKLDEQSRAFEESNTQNKARMDQLIQLVNSIKFNSSNKNLSNSSDASEMEHFPMVKEQDGRSLQVRNTSNPIQEVESASKQLNPRIENLRNKKVTISEMFSGTNFQDFCRNNIVPLLESDITKSEKCQILKKWILEGTNCVQTLDYVYSDISSHGCNLVQQILDKKDPFQPQMMSDWVEFRTLLALLNTSTYESQLKFERLRQFSKRLPYEIQSLVIQYINQYLDDFGSIVIKLRQYISRVVNDSREYRNKHHSFKYDKG